MMLGGVVQRQQAEIRQFVVSLFIQETWLNLLLKHMLKIIIYILC